MRRAFIRYISAIVAAVCFAGGVCHSTYAAAMGQAAGAVGMQQGVLSQPNLQPGAALQPNLQPGAAVQPAAPFPGVAAPAQAGGTGVPGFDPSAQTGGAGAASVVTPAQLMQISGFYSNTVLVGDSVMVGFRNYCARSSDPVMKQLKFLAAGSLSLHNAFWDVSSRSVHPLYMGAQRQVWESVQLMGAQRVFLFFGINDMCYGVEPTLPLYLQLVSKIKEYSPAAEITIISATYTKKDRGKGLLNNANIAAFNSNMQMLAAKNGWGFIDIATPLSDGAGNLLPAYCSDNYLHQTNSAYEVWRLAMYGYARKRLGI